MPGDDNQAAGETQAESPQFVDLTKAEEPLAPPSPPSGPAADTRPLSPPGSPLARDEVFAFTDQGQRIRIHQDRLADVVKHGGIPGIRMLDPNGEPHTVPVTRMKEAMQNRMTMPPEPTDHADKHGYGLGGTLGYIGDLMTKWDWWGRVASDVGDNLSGPLRAEVRRPLTPQGTTAVTPEAWQPSKTEPAQPTLGQRAVGVVGALAGTRQDVYQQRATAGDGEGVASQAMADIVTNLMMAGAADVLHFGVSGIRAARTAPVGAAATAEEAITRGTAQAAQETGLPAGAAAQPAVRAVPAVPKVPAVPPVEDVAAMEQSRQAAHAQAHQGMREVFAKAATDTGVDPAPAGTPLRNLVTDLRQKIWDRSTATFKKLDTESGGRWQRFNEGIANNEKVVADNIGIDNEKAAKADEEVERLTQERDAMVEELIKNKQIDPTDAAQATEDFATQKALIQVQKVTQDTTRPATAMRAEEITNPDAMEKRLQALFDQPRGDTKYSGERLQRALGDDNAETLLTHLQKLNDQLSSMERFKSMIGGTPEVPGTPGIPGRPAMPASGLARFREIVQKATDASPRLVGGKQVFVTDWGKAHKAFINMGDGEKALAFGQQQRDVGEFLAEMAESQAREVRQERIRKGLWKAAGVGGIFEAGRFGADIPKLAGAGKVAGVTGYLLGKEVVRRGVRAVQAAEGETEEPSEQPAEKPQTNVKSQPAASERYDERWTEDPANPRMPKFKGMLAKGNIDLVNRPHIPTPSGTATVHSMSFEEDGQHILVPTAVMGSDHILNQDEAIARYHRTHEFIGKFDNEDDATAYSHALHEQEDAINQAGQKYGVPDKMVRALIKQESQFNPRAQSDKGAQGLTQLMPETQKQYGVGNPWDVYKNVEAGVHKLKDLHDKYGSWRKALAAYNAGERPKKEGGGPRTPETGYVENIMRDFGGSD